MSYTKKDEAGNWAVIAALMGSILAFIAALIAAGLSYYTAMRASDIQERVALIQQAQSDAERQSKATQFDRESARQYISIIYGDLVSENPGKQRIALSLLSVMEPDVGIKILAWANASGIVRAENRQQASEVEKNLRNDSSRFIVYVHLGSAGGRVPPSRDAALNALSASGFRIGGTDSLADRYGPGVDYFHERDKSGAQSVADALSRLSPPGASPIPVRFQAVANREGTLGVWF